MSDDNDTTIRIRRGGNVGTDSRGRTVWTKPIDTVELELVSTQMLEQIIESGNESQTQKLRALAGTESGVLARDTRTDEYQIVSDEELEAALRAGSESTGSAPANSPQKPAAEKGDIDSLSLVSTQMLRKLFVLGQEEPKAANEKPDTPGRKGGYNPYDRG